MSNGDEEVRRVSEALDDVDRIEDVEARVRARNQVMARQAERNREWQDERRTLILAMRAETPPVTFRKIAERLSMSLATVQDAVRGYSGPGTHRPRKPKPQPPEEGS